MAESRIALITGANKGIGKEIARQLGTQGLTVLLGARDAQRGEEAATELRQQGVDARSILIDVTDQASIDAAARRIEGEFGKLDVLVNNAGIALDNGPASETELETLRRTYDTNVFGVFAVTKSLRLCSRRRKPDVSSICPAVWGRSRKTAIPLGNLQA